MNAPNRRDVLKGMGLAGASLLVGPQLAAAAEGFPGRRPNIILVLTDDQGYGDLSCHGNPILKTPNIDRLHAEGVRFSDFVVSPTCAPTRSSILTGRHEFKSGITHTILERERMSLKSTTLADVLKAAGYSTGIFGKWHLGDEEPYQPNHRGFDEYFIHGAGGIGQTYAGSCGDAPGNTYFDPVIRHNGTFVKTNGYCTDVFFAQALTWIEKVKAVPFFACITPNAPHGPLQVRPEDEQRYAGKTPDAASAKFFGMIANIDDNVGRLLAKLSELGIDNDTLVIFMNDNGGTAGLKVFNAGMRGGKGGVYRGGTRAASFWRWPGKLKPADVPALSAHIDIFPTLAAIAGAAVPADIAKAFDGRSLIPQLRDPAAPAEDRFIFSHVGRWPKGADPARHKYDKAAVRWRHYNAVAGMAPKARGRWQLFDLAADPGESTDIAEKHPEIIARINAAYDAWWASVLPCMENEKAEGPAINTYKELYWKQYKGPGPNNVPPPANRQGA